MPEGGGGGLGLMHCTDVPVVVSGGKRAAGGRRGHSLCVSV